MTRKGRRQPLHALMSGQILAAMGIIEQRFRASKASFLEDDKESVPRHHEVVPEARGLSWTSSRYERTTDSCGYWPPGKAAPDQRSCVSSEITSSKSGRLGVWALLEGRRQDGWTS